MLPQPKRYSQQDLAFVDRQITLLKQQIEFERVTFGNSFPLGNSQEVTRLLDNLHILYMQRAVIAFSILQDY